jgi:hypothetical protein
MVRSARGTSPKALAEGRSFPPPLSTNDSKLWRINPKRKFKQASENILTIRQTPPGPAHGLSPVILTHIFRQEHHPLSCFALDELFART